MILPALLLAGAALQAPSRATDSIQLLYRDTVRIERPGTTAAYAVDARIVEASLSAGQVVLIGAGVGTTRVTVIGPGGIETWSVDVVSPPSLLGPLGGRSTARRTAVWSEHYDSETSRVTSSLDVDWLTGGGLPVQLRVVNLTKAQAVDDGFGRSAFPFAALSIGRQGRRVILGDTLVSHSPLTLDGNLLRGVHVHAGRLEAHAGFASALVFGSLFVPAERETAFGASYGLGPDSLRVSPSLYFFPDAADARPGSRTLLPSLLVERDTKDRLQFLGEVGWSDGLALAGDVSYDSPAHRIRARGRHQPYGLPALSLGHPQGTFADLAWSARLARPLGLTLTGASARYDDPRAPRRTAGASADLAWSIARRWSARAGVSLGRFDAEGAPRVETLSVPAGLTFEAGRFGASALYRYQTNSATNRGGSGGRVSLHAGGRLRLSAFADYQRDAPTLSLILDDYPEVERALIEQGLVATTPEDIARFLDANALLLAGGDTVRLTLDPSRAQAGFDVTWTGATTQARLHGLFNRTETLSRTEDTRLGSISLTQRIGGTELTAAYTRWASDTGAFGQAGGAFQLGFRQRFSGGAPGSSRSARISGQVYRDDGASEDTTGAPGVPGVTVRLSDGRTAVTDAGGRFAFDNVGRRGRRVEAVLPAPNAFYTTPSPVDVKDSAVVRFGLRFAEGRLAGVVRDDAGQPVGGVTLRLAGAAGARSAVSDSLGGYVFNAGEGDYELSLDPSSLPTGYEATAAVSRSVHISLTAPAQADLAVRVQRSISGRLAPRGSGAAPGRAGIEVRLRKAGRAVFSDEEGRFLFRNVGAGPDTLEATVDGRLMARTVDVPEGPAMLRDVELTGRGPAAAAAVAGTLPVAPVTVRAPPVGDPVRAGAALFAVQHSAYRDRAAAMGEAERLRRELGRPARVVAADLGEQGLFHRVLVGEFSSSGDAHRFRAAQLASGSGVGPVHRLVVTSGRDGVLRSRHWSGGPVYGVQVASYPDRAVAEAAASRLAAAGRPPVQVFAVDLGTRGVWHRVLVIGFSDADAAHAHRARLRDEGKEPGPVFRIEGGG